MKKIFFSLFIILLLAGCAGKAPSVAIMETAQKEVAAVQKTVERLEKTTPPECKTDVFLANLEVIKTQMTVFNDQLENMNTACKTEKQVLEEKISKRNIIIGFLAVIIGLMVALWVRKKLV